MAHAETRRAWGDIDDEVVRSALRQLDRRLRAKLGDRYSKLILFGSRARGDHRPDSDADVAIVLRDRNDKTWPMTQSVLAETYDILLDTGLYIDPWLIDDAALQGAETADHSLLAREILRDGYTP